MMNKKLEKRRGNQIISIAALSIIAVGIVIILLGITFYKNRISEFGVTEKTDYQEYKYHYAIISEEEDAEFWEAIYQGAMKKGGKQNAYVEVMGKNLSISYSIKDLMKIAIAAKVDGIILEPNGEEDIVKLIDAADAAGIPVVTVLMDAPLSKRKSFVGVNSYNQGQAYAKQVLEIVGEGKHNITVLMNEDNTDTSQTVIYSSILEMTEREKVEIKTATVNTQSTFSSAEDIRNIIMDKDNPPDVLVCLTATDTLCAYQAVVDYNKVGQIDIIGYYDSDTILRAIEKNIVHSTMTIDADRMGAYCVEALTEYRKTKNVSDYYSVDISVINAENVDKYIEEEPISE